MLCVELERLLAGHGANPVLRWNASNVAVLPGLSEKHETG